MTPTEALAAIDRIYQEIVEIQSPGYQYGHELHEVGGYAMYLEHALTGLGQAECALREHLGIEEDPE